MSYAYRPTYRSRGSRRTATATSGGADGSRVNPSNLGPRHGPARGVRRASTTRLRQASERTHRSGERQRRLAVTGTTIRVKPLNNWQIITCVKNMTPAKKSPFRHSNTADLG